MYFDSNIKLLRKRKKLTQDEVAAVNENLTKSNREKKQQEEQIRKLAEDLQVNRTAIHT